MFFTLRLCFLISGTLLKRALNCLGIIAEFLEGESVLHVCMYEYHMNAWCWKGQKRSSNPWCWLYKWLWVTEWVLGIKPCSLAKATRVLNRWATSPAPVLFLFLSLLICLSLRLEHASSILCFEPVLTAQNKEVLEMFKVSCSIIWINLRLSSKLIFSRFEPN